MSGKAALCILEDCSRNSCVVVLHLSASAAFNGLMPVDWGVSGNKLVKCCALGPGVPYSKQNNKIHVSLSHVMSDVQKINR